MSPWLYAFMGFSLGGAFGFFVFALFAINRRDDDEDRLDFIEANNLKISTNPGTPRYWAVVNDNFEALSMALTPREAIDKARKDMTLG